MIDIHDGQITDLFSNTIRHNPETIAMAYAILQEKRRILSLVERTRLMSAIDSLDERILDYLAVELRTPAYEDSLPLETKRTLIKGTLPFYAKLGTPAAVDWVINAIFVGTGSVEEWFDYGGEPHHFRIQAVIDHAIMSLDELERLIRAVYTVKRLSSWLDEIRITIELPPTILHVGGGVGVQTSFGVPLELDSYAFQDALHIGGDFGTQPSISVPVKLDAYDFRDTLYVGGRLSSQTNLPISEDIAQPPSTTILRTGGVCTIISNLSKGE